MHANYESAQNPADTPNLRPNGGRPLAPCPSWCVRDEDYPAKHPDDRCRIHYTDEVEAAGYDVKMVRYDWEREAPRPGPVSVMLDGEFLSPRQALALAGVLLTTAAKADPSEETIVRTLDLPEGQEYLVFADANVVGLSSRLDEDRRREVLHDLGLT
jgi:hypothetical protein